MKTSVRDILAPGPASASKHASFVGVVLTVYLICDAVDAPAARSVEDWLFEQGFVVIRPLSGGDERELREDHKENLKTCDAVLIYHGRTTEFWLRTKLRDLQKAFAYGRQRPFRARAVLLADPKTRDKERLLSPGVVTIPMFGGFNPLVIQRFVNNGL